MYIKDLIKNVKLKGCLEEAIDGVYNLRGYCNIDVQEDGSVELPFGKVQIEFVGVTDEFLNFTGIYCGLRVPLNVRISDLD